MQRRRMPTMRDVADHVGVSRQLVSLVLRGAPGPSAESRDRILAAAEDLGYRPNASARLLRQRRTHLIGVLFSMRNPFEVRFVEQLESRATALGYGLVLGARSEDRSDDAVIEQLMVQRIEALIAFNPDPGAAGLADAVERIPVVWMGERASIAGVDNVRVDENGGLRLAIDHLAESGHRDIAYAGGRGGVVGRDRAKAYLTAMQGAGLGSNVNVLVSDFDEESGAAVARQLAHMPTATRPTAVICCGDLNATAVLASFAHLGVRVPEDISVVGFDDSYVAALSYNRLTSIRQDVDVTAAAAMARVVDRLDDGATDPVEVLTATALTVRASSGASPR